MRMSKKKNVQTVGDARRGSGKDKDVVDVGLPAVLETVDLDALVGGVRCCLSCHTHAHTHSLSLSLSLSLTHWFGVCVDVCGVCMSLCMLCVVTVTLCTIPPPPSPLPSLSFVLARSLCVCVCE